MPRRLGALRLWSVAAVAVALVVLGVACGDGDQKNEAGRITVDGRAEVGAPGEDITEVRGTAPVHYGQRVNVREGTAVIRLSGTGDRQLELRGGSNVELASGTGSASAAVSPVLLGGGVLVTTGTGELALTAGEVGIVVRGAAQVSGGQPMVVSSYTGSADVAVAGQTVTVPALRQLVVPAAGPLPATPAPVAYDAGDAWDLRYLGDAMALGDELDARSQGFSAQVGPSDGHTADFFRGLLDPLAGQPSFTDEALSADRPPGETLVGAAIAVEATMGTFDERWIEVFAFRDQGASWGLVALDQGVTRSPLVTLVDEAIGKGPSLITTTPPAGSDGAQSGIALPRTPTGGSGSSSGNGNGNGSGSGSGGQSGTDPPPASPTTTLPAGGSPPGPKGPLNTGVPVIDDLVNALVDTLSGLLRGLGGG